MEIVRKYLCLFFVYSILGWCMESFRGYFKTGKFVNRGFLIGPYCPVYGLGVSLITFFLEKYVNDIIILFGMSIIICGLLEYFTSWIMEKVFKARWWDYHNRKFNINGRICLETLLPFGILGTILLKFFNPLILGLLNKIPYVVFVWLIRIILIIFIIDFIVSFNVILNFRKAAKQVEKEEAKDNTEEIVSKVKEITTEKVLEIKENTEEMLSEAKEDLENLHRKINVRVNKVKRHVRFTRKRIHEEYTLKVKERFLEKSWLNKRLAKAFPNLQVKLKKLKK